MLVVLGCPGSEYGKPVMVRSSWLGCPGDELLAWVGRAGQGVPIEAEGADHWVMEILLADPLSADVMGSPPLTEVVVL